MFNNFKTKCLLHIFLLILSLTKVQATFKTYSYVTDNSGPESDLAEILSSKSYVPPDNQLPKGRIVTNDNNDVTYLLSNLSDEELIKLLTEQPDKNEYDLNDIAKVAVGINVKKQTVNKKHNPVINKPAKQGVGQMGFYRLENKRVDHADSEKDPNYLALQKLHNLLYARPQIDVEDLDDNKKQLLFDVLVNQLKLLCCKKTSKSKPADQFGLQKLKNVFSDLNQDEYKTKTNSNIKPKEYMFLIINEEIKSNVSEEIVFVDPETLQQNSSILLLGPITTPLGDNQLKLIMDRIENELSKPEYTTLLQQLAGGVLSEKNQKLLKNFIRGPQTRRYIKPHRCNHQSKLARVYGGTKWLICTGYININTPSLYD